MTSQPRPLRADAERNRQAIICAAGTVFAQEGMDVTLERIAEAAGVGVGTIYRRFATVDELVAVVLEEKMRRYADRSEEAAEQARTEPWEAFRDYVMFILEQQATDLAFSDLIVSPRGMSELFHEHNERAFRASVVLVERARDAGALRPGFHHSDLYLLTNANRGVLQGTQRVAPDGWRRFAEYVLDGFRGPGTIELTPPSLAWQRAVQSDR
ncbi:TetR/AcrR family transcriptional regulator [Arsenicicoccus bolidensis]|uniref:TetR/AcrR family transcriptional regulator n=1 Tax=Arsenicicoccus bolidensis TaxID=229480 RepID=UPI0028A6174D|nr:TetR/AcrR family transcriptional regulator [Arsenicicoccus bolidensis]